MKITLCGSARFEEHFKKWNERLTLVGHVVHTLAVYPSDKPEGKDWYTDTQKTALDKAHKLKIEASEAILVLNVDGYIGESTAAEIAHARFHNKKIFYICWTRISVASADLTRMKGAVNICGYAGCPDPITLRQPCALCYE